MNNHGELTIVDFSQQYAADFRRLNVEWITRHWQLEEADENALGKPKEYIIDKGGAIFIALYGDRAVGSVALIPYDKSDKSDKSTLELAKMAVSPAVQGKGIGLELAHVALRHAQHMGAKRVYLESNTILKPAIALYEKLGFRRLQNAVAPSPYARCNVRMEKFLDSKPV